MIIISDTNGDSFEMFGARDEQRSRQARTERKPAEKLDVISIGRSLSRSFTTDSSLASHDREEIYTRCGGENSLLLTKSNMRAILFLLHYVRHYHNNLINLIQEI